MLPVPSVAASGKLFQVIAQVIRAATILIWAHTLTMVNSSETSYPLTSSTVEFNYCHDRPLRSLATRFTHVERHAQDSGNDSSGIQTTCCLMFCSGISLRAYPSTNRSPHCSLTLRFTEKETWLPVIKRLFDLASQPNSRVVIHSIWVIERPNHGDAAMLNEALLKEFYHVQCTSSFQ